MQDAGAIRIDLDLADGLICAAAIRSTRPLGLARLFVGRPAAEAPVLASRLFTLCGQAQRAACAAAIRAAQGAEAPKADRREALAVAAERLFETLRSMTLGWPGAPAPSRRQGEALRDAAQAAAKLARSDGGVGEMADAVARLGFAGAAPSSDSTLGALLRDGLSGAVLALAPPDTLAPADDAAISRALADDPAGFAAAPELAGRRPETGAYARLWREVPETRDPLAARAWARFLDVRQALGDLRALVAGATATPTGGRTGEREGYGAVECARGRLFHWARLDRDDRIAAYAILAPTEWNFHPSGPLAAALVGARAGSAKAARDAALKLAALVDPCVGFEVSVREAA